MFILLLKLRLAELHSDDDCDGSLIGSTTNSYPDSFVHSSALLMSPQEDNSTPADSRSRFLGVADIIYLQLQTEDTTSCTINMRNALTNSINVSPKTGTKTKNLI